MAFRNDLEAAHARADALDKRVAELEAENERLRRGEPDPAPEPGGRAMSLIFGLGFPAVAAALAWIALKYDAPLIAASIGATGGLWLLLLIVFAALSEKVPPQAALVLSGRPRLAPDGRRVGFRVVTQGSVVRIPFVEQVSSIDLRPVTATGAIRNAYSKDGTPMSVDFTLTVRIADTEPAIIDAIERFLGRPSGEIAQVAKETVGGHLRGVVAQLTPQEIQHDREKFELEVIGEAEADCAKLGLVLDSLEVEHVMVDI